MPAQEGFSKSLKNVIGVTQPNADSTGGLADRSVPNLL